MEKSIKRERMQEMLRGACLKAIVVFQIKIPSRKEKKII